MQPLSTLKRRLYLGGLVLLFFILFPVVIFFADGYRYRAGLGFVQTGGIYVSVPYSNAIVYFNGSEYGRSSFLQRSFYIDNLTPGKYTVRVTRSDSNTWERELYVEPQLVTDTNVLLVPLKFDILKVTTSTSTATTTRVIPRAALLEIQQLFKEPSATTTASSIQGQALVVRGGNVYDTRTNVLDNLPPSNFCARPSLCVAEIPIENGPDTALSAAYFGGGILFSTKENGVFFAESDVRFAPVIASVYPKKGADFRIIDDMLIVKDGTNFYEIVGL